MTGFALYLASTSPRRRELLGQIGVQVAVLSISVDESLFENESPEGYVQRLSMSKAAAGWHFIESEELDKLPVLGSDTTVVLDGEILGKPNSPDQCVANLLALSGRTHQVMTSVCVRRGDKITTALSVTEVTFSAISQEQAVRYWYTGEPQDKAGGYGIQGYGAVFVEKIAGSYSGVVGLPIEKTVELLKQFEVPIWQTI